VVGNHQHRRYHYWNRNSYLEIEEHMKQQFNPTLAIEVDRHLEKIAYSISYALADAIRMKKEFEAETDRLYIDGVGPHPLCSNLMSFGSRFDWVFNEKVMRLDKEIDSLRRDWQLKLGAFDKTTGEWTYE